MSRHLSEAELVEWVEGAAEPAARAHVAECAECRDRGEAFRGALDLAADAEIPEPPQDYWGSFRQGVDGRIARDAARARSTSRWLVPGFAGLAAALVLAVLLPRPAPPPAPQRAEAPALPAWSALPESDDVGLELIQALAPSPEEAAWESCRAAYDCLASLTDSETAALTETLERDLDGRSL